MSTMLKYIAVWIVSAIGGFAAIYVVGSFCALSLDLTVWTSPAGRFVIALISCCVGGMGVATLMDEERFAAMSREEREEALARREVTNRTHADY